MIYTGRHYASAIYSVVMCPSVCLSQVGTASKRLDESNWFLTWRLPFIYSTRCYKVTWTWVSPKIGVLPSGILSQTPDLETFAKQVDRVVNNTRRRRRRSSLLTTPIISYHIISYQKFTVRPLLREPTP